MDENDSPPELTVPENCVQITEFHDLNDPIVPLKVKDNDDPTTPNGQVKFAIKRGNEQAIFDIKQIDFWHASIYANRPLNGLYGNYSLVIEVRDLGIPENVVEKQVEICIQDYNDHPPMFVSPSNNFTIRIPEVLIKNL